MASVPEILLNFEKAAYHFDPAVLVWPGLVMVGAGLVLWLAGLRMSRVCAVVLGVITGGLIGYGIWPQSRASGAFFGATVASMMAFIFDKFIIVLLGSVIVGLIMLTVISANYLDRADMRGFPTAQYDGRMDQQQSFSHMATVVDYCWSSIGGVWRALNKVLMLPPMLMVIVMWFIGIFAARLVVAFACSTVGAALIFSGMVWLLLYKGSGPLSFMYQRLWFFMVVFMAMAAGGTIVQMLLCPGRTVVVPEDNMQQEKMKDRVKHV